MKIKSSLFLVLLLSSTLNGQTMPDLRAMRQQRATQELSTALAETQPATNGSYVWVRAMSADLMWSQDEPRARQLFKDLWAWINKQDEVILNQVDSRSILLLRLFKRDPALARELIASASGSNNEKQLIKVASELVDSDPGIAGELLNQTISKVPTLEALNVLTRLQSRDVNTADGVALRLLRSLATQPPSVSLPVIYSLNYYVFPSQRGEREVVLPRSNVLRQQYFVSGDDVLTRSLREQSISQEAKEGPLQTRFQQAQLANILALLSKQYAPLRQVEFQNLALQLSTNLPGDVRQITKALLERIDGSKQEVEGTYKSNDERISPSEELLHALARNDFDQAKWILDRMDEGDLKKKLRRAVKISEFSYLCSHGQLSKALSVAVTVDDADRKIFMLNGLARLIYAKNSSPDAETIREFRLALKSIDSSPAKVSTVYLVAALASQSSTVDAMDWMRYGNSCLNSLESSGRAFGKSQLYEFEQSFVALGRVDFENVIVEASVIRDPFMRQIAKLAASENWLLGDRSLSATTTRKSAP